MRSDTARGAFAAALFSLWIWLLFAGFAGFAVGGAVHLLLALALVAFPWRALRASPRPIP